MLYSTGDVLRLRVRHGGSPGVWAAGFGGPFVILSGLGLGAFLAVSAHVAAVLGPNPNP